MQTGSESSVDRLMKQITSFMSEIPDEFKVVVVQAIRSVASCHLMYFMYLTALRLNWSLVLFVHLTLISCVVFILWFHILSCT